MPEIYNQLDLDHQSWIKDHANSQSLDRRQSQTLQATFLTSLIVSNMNIHNIGIKLSYSLVIDILGCPRIVHDINCRLGLGVDYKTLLKYFKDLCDDTISNFVRAPSNCQIHHLAIDNNNIITHPSHRRINKHGNLLATITCINLPVIIDINKKLERVPKQARDLTRDDFLPNMANFEKIRNTLFQRYRKKQIVKPKQKSWSIYTPEHFKSALPVKLQSKQSDRSVRVLPSTNKDSSDILQVIDTIADCIKYCKIDTKTDRILLTVDQEMYKMKHKLQAELPSLVVIPGDWHFKKNTLEAIYSLYSPLGLRDLIIDIGIKRDLGNVEIFIESYEPIEMILEAFIISAHKEYERRQIDLTFDSWMIHMKGQVKRIQMWSSFFEVAAPSIVILHEATRRGTEADFSHRQEAMQAVMPLLVRAGKENYKKLYLMQQCT